MNAEDRERMECKEQAQVRGYNDRQSEKKERRPAMDAYYNRREIFLLSFWT